MRKPLLVAVLVGAAAIVTALAVIALVSRPDGGASNASRPEITVAHVHGLGVDPGDGALHVATHFGLFRLDDKRRPGLVSVESHDFMGFSVAGPGRFLASGHPAVGSTAFGALARRLLGLIESTDGGRTWQAVSLSGEVDFHALEVAHGAVYGFDATGGQLMVSMDGGQHWEVRSQIAVIDFAVDPADRERIIASTRQGAVESLDGGRTWTPFDGAPQMVFVDWHTDRGMWALGADGRVHALADGTWEVHGHLGGAPQALLVHDDGVVAAVDDGSTAIHSFDGSGTWELLYRETPER